MRMIHVRTSLESHFTSYAFLHALIVVVNSMTSYILYKELIWQFKMTDLSIWANGARGTSYFREKDVQELKNCRIQIYIAMRARISLSIDRSRLSYYCRPPASSSELPNFTLRSVWKQIIIFYKWYTLSYHFHTTTFIPLFSSGRFIRFCWRLVHFNIWGDSH